MTNVGRTWALMVLAVAGATVVYDVGDAPARTPAHPGCGEMGLRGAWWAEVDSFGSGLGRLHGSVYAERGTPLASAMVFIEESHLGAVTDDSGGFDIDSIPAGLHELSVMLIGYGRQRHEISVVTERADTMCFTLREIFLDLTGISVGETSR